MKLTYTSDALKKKLSEKEQETLGKEIGRVIFDTVLSALVEGLHKGKLTGSQSRKLSRVLNALDTSDDCSIEVKEEDALFIKELFSNEQIELPYRLIRLYAMTAELIDKSFATNEDN